jgi:hypothetical protein
MLKLVNGSHIVQKVNELSHEKYGDDVLVRKGIEEFIELLNILIQVSKGAESKGNWDNLIEEMGDAMLMMYQLMHIFEQLDPEFTDKMNASMYAKLTNIEFKFNNGEVE